MAQLSSFTGGDVEINASERLVTITGGVLSINGVLDPPTGFDDWGGWRIVCDSYGRPSGTGATTFTPTAYDADDDDAITLSSTNYNLTDTGKRFTFTNLGGYSGSYGSPSTNIDTSTKYYIRKIGSNKIKFYVNQNDALNDANHISFSTNGTISTMRIQYDNARGGFRSTTGASGTLGGGKQSLVIIEKRNGHRFGGDNFSGSNGANARFAGNGTNLMKYHNISWVIEPGGRSDFDIGRGTNANGSAGPKVELSGVHVTQLSETGNDPNFNHYSGQATIKNHPEVGYGLRITNYTTAHVIEFSTPIQDGAFVEGLIIDNIASPTNHAGATNARVGVRLNNVPLNGTLTLSNLNTPSITDVEGGSNAGSKTLLLVDPVGLPTITDNWGRHVNLEVRRTIPFVFSGMSVPNGTSLWARSETTGGQNATSTVSGDSGSIQVRTQRTANNTTTTWTNYNDYQFFMAGLAFRKYALATTQTIGNTPPTITANIIADELPDGTAISTITLPNSGNLPSTLSDIIRLIKAHELDNVIARNYPPEPLMYVDGNAIKLHSDYRITLDSADTRALWNIGQISGHDTIEMRTEDSIDASNGLTTLDVTGTGETITNSDNVDEGSGVFFKDSTGQRSIVGVTNNMGATTRFAVVDTSDGSTLASSDVANGSTGNLSITTTGLTTGYKLVSKRPGYNYYSVDVDLTGGGLKSFTAPPQNQIVQPDGSGSYVSGVSVPADELDVSFTLSGTTPVSRVNCGNETFTARQIFKVWEEGLAGSAGDKYMGLGGGQITYTLSALKGNEIVLGSNTKVKRKRTTDSNATIRATLYATDDQPVDNANGDVMTIEGLDEVRLSTALWSADSRTLTSGGGGGGGATAQQIWEYSDRSLTSDAAPSASDVADEIWGRRYHSTTLIPSSLDSGSIVFDADDRVLVPNLTAVKIANLGGYTGPNTTDTYIVADDGSGKRPLYRTRDEALANQIGDRINFTGAGTAGLVRVDVLSPVAIEMTYDIHDNTSEIPQDVWLYATRELTNTTSLATSVAAGVWARPVRTLSSTDNVWSNSNALTNAGIADAVWSETERTLTAADNITADIADAVWDEDITIVGNTESTITPSFVASSSIGLETADAVGITNGSVIRVSSTGGLTGWDTETDYYARVSGTTLNLYTTRAQSLVGGNTGLIDAGGISFSGVELTTTRQAVTRNLGQARDVIEAILLDTEAVLPAPTIEQITNAVWGEVIDGGITSDLTITPESKAGDGFRIPADDAVLISNGDAFTFTNTGGYSGLSTASTYYAYVSSNVLYVYDTKHNALTPGSQWEQPSGGTIGDVRIKFDGKKPIGTAGVALHRILAGVAELDSDQELNTEATAAIGVLLNRLLGSDFVEGGLSLQQALQICTAVLAGKLSVNQDGTTFTFHRLDTGETAVIRSDASDTGRTNPTRDPT